MLTCEECLDHMGYNPCPGHPAPLGWPSECSDAGFCPRTRPNKRCEALGPGHIFPAPDGPIIEKTPIKVERPNGDLRFRDTWPNVEVLIPPLEPLADTPLELEKPTIEKIETIFVPQITERFTIQREKSDGKLEKFIIFGVIGLALFLLK